MLKISRFAYFVVNLDKMNDVKCGCMESYVSYFIFFSVYNIATITNK